MTQPVGIFGGTFDPIHYGHLRTAFEMLEALRFATVLFVPGGDPPHRGPTHAAAERRLEMVTAATARERRFAVDDCELRREGPSYTIDTLASKRAEFSSTPIGLIMGMDAFLGLPSWHRWDELLDFAHIVVAHRPGWKVPDAGPLGEMISRFGTASVEDLHGTLRGRVHIHEVTQLEISSTEIRELIRAGRDPRYLLPDQVRDVIMDSGCYR